MKTQFDFNELFEGVEETLAYKTEAAVLEFTEELVARMESQGVSRADLARKIGCSPAYVTKILRGGTNFTLETMVKIADVLGCAVRTHLQPEGIDEAKPLGTASVEGVSIEKGRNRARSAKKRMGHLSQ
jgi:transcriptional regulator with XRE-family HTH domain